MEDLKLLSRSEVQIETLVNKTVHIFSKESGMEFGLKKCRILVKKRGEVVRREEITLPYGEIMKEYLILHQEKCISKQLESKESGNTRIRPAHSTVVKITLGATGKEGNR